MLVWGGSGGNGSGLNTGAIYDPANDQWAPMQTPSNVDPRLNHTAVWTGSQMLVWGGINSSAALNTGAAYDPSTDQWTTMDTVSAPQARQYHTALWTGSDLLVFGGTNADHIVRFGTGGEYTP
jgi:N-acetylneuraminic acid mutarotase